MEDPVLGSEELFTTTPTPEKFAYITAADPNHFTFTTLWQSYRYHKRQEMHSITYTARSTCMLSRVSASGSTSIRH